MLNRIIECINFGGYHTSYEKMILPLDPNFETASNSDTWKQRLYIHEVQINDPFSMTMKNDFTD